MNTLRTIDRVTDSFFRGLGFASVAMTLVAVVVAITIYQFGVK